MMLLRPLRASIRTLVMFECMHSYMYTNSMIACVGGECIDEIWRCLSF